MFIKTIQQLMAKRCDTCPLCQHARKNPESFLGKLMAWHGKWCPFWKAWEKSKNPK